MKVKTAKGVEFDCDGILPLNTPPRLYLHLFNTSVEAVREVLEEDGQLPIEGYPLYNAIQSITSPSPSWVKVSLKIEGT